MPSTSRPMRRPGALGVHSLDHFAFVVPDLDAATSFYSAFGLRTATEGEGIGLYTHGNTHRWGRIGSGKRKLLSYVSFGAFEDDLPQFSQRLDALKVKRCDPPQGVVSNGLWFEDCDGMLVEIGIAAKTAPDQKSTPVLPSTPGTRAAPLRESAEPVRPRRLAHILLFTPNVAQKVKYYRDVFGLRLSDEAGGAVAFMHGVHGSDHHLVAFAQSNGIGLHHCSWDVSSPHDVGFGGSQMAAKGYSAGWGFGRHVLGSNYFFYVRDPWGSYSEYSYDIDYIPADIDWQTGSHAPDNSLYLWGPPPPADFIVNYETA